jgi:N-acetyl-gamma-glutamyl-phosphate reductase common form
VRDLRVGIVGARGHTGRELLRLLSKHPRFEVAFVTSRELAGRAVQTEAPESDASLRFEDLSPEACAAREVDAYVLALPNGASAPYVSAIDAGRPSSVIVDLSADHRFDDAWVYGQPERRRALVGKSHRIANPGCYATAFQLAAEPLLAFVVGPVHGFGVSGYSGAGTTPSPRNDPAALADSVLPYALVDHTHEREVAHQLGHAVRFVPHVAPFFRGLSVTVSASLAGGATREAIARALEARYGAERLVKLDAEPPTAKMAKGRHEVRIGGLVVSDDRSHVAVVAALDNLLAGAATTAVRNLNLALGLEELAGVEPWL